MVKILGAGTIEKLGKNSYRVRFNLGYDKVAKRYRYSPWRHVTGNKAQAEKVKAEYRNELENGLALDADRVTFREFAERYLSQRKALGAYAPSTIRHDTERIAILNEHLGDMPLREISAAVIKNFMATLGEAGRKPSSIRRTYAVLKRILREAVIQDLLLRDPCTKVKAPKVAKPELSYLNTEGIGRFLVALEATENEGMRLMALPPVRKDAKQSGGQLQGISLLSRCMAVHVALATGARRGEVLGLVWGCVDFEGQCIRVAQQMTLDGIRVPKTERGKRIVSLDVDTLERLSTWKRRQSEYLLSLGIAQDGQTPVITDELGGFHDPSNFSSWWRDFRKQYGFAGLKFHHLRHTHATLLIGGNIDIKTVQGRLGHTLASTTLDIYASVMPEKDREAADLIGSILDQKPPEMGKVVSL